VTANHYHYIRILSCTFPMTSALLTHLAINP